MTGSLQFRAYAALFAVYFFWGTTYLGIRMALESFTPMRLISLRFLASGLILLAAAKLKGVKLPQGRELWLTALYGLMLLGGGTGTLVYAESWVPSGMAALFISTTPFWMVGLTALLPGGEKIHGPTIASIFLGFIGVLILVLPEVTGVQTSSGLFQGFLVLQAGCFSWCLGSLLQKRLVTSAHPVVSGAIQQVATGLLFLPVAYSGRR